MIATFYDAETLEQAEQRFPLWVALGIGIMMAGVIFSVLCQELPLSEQMLEELPGAVMLVFVAVGAPILVYTGLDRAKYAIGEYNRTNNPSLETKSKEDEVGGWSGIIMIMATIVFFLWGFAFEIWEMSWLAFPIGGMLCGVAAIWVKIKA